MKKSKKIVIIVIGVIVVLGIIAVIASLFKSDSNSASTPGIGSSSQSNNENSYVSLPIDDSEWDDFIGENNGKSGKVTAAPEVDDMGNEVDSKTEIRKPDTDDSSEFAQYQLDIPENAVPEVYLDKWLEGVVQNDWIQVQLLSYGFTSNQKLSEQKAAHYVFEALTWEIGEKTEDEEGIYFLLNLTAPNVKDAAASYIINNNFDEGDTNLADRIDDDMKNIVDKVDRTTIELKVQLLEDEGIWKVYITEELLSGISGGLSTLYTELQQEYLEEVVNP